VDFEHTLINGHCYSDPLRLRGGGDESESDDDVDMTQSGGTSGDMVATSSGQKRGLPSPEAICAKQPKTANMTVEHRELNDLIGWLEQTVTQEKGKKLGVQTSEKIMGKLSRLRVVANSLAHDKSRLLGEIKGKEDTQKMSLTCFIEKLDNKNVEANRLKAELDALKNRSTVSQATVARPTTNQVPAPRSTYSEKAASAPKATVATAPKSKKAAEKKQLESSRNTKATTRFMLEIPSGVMVARAKTGVWETVKSKLKNPRAKTIVSGQSLIIIPDDNNTLEVMKGLENVIEITSYMM